jgi:hypothetical protein
MFQMCCEKSKDCSANVVLDMLFPRVEDTSLAYVLRDADRHFEALSGSRTLHKQGAEL